MSKFALRIIDAIKGKQKFYELSINGSGQLEQFESSLEEIYKSEYRTVVARLDQVANLQRLPATKFRDITPKSESVKEYEVKTKHLRVYIIHIEKTGKAVVLCGYKNSQKSDIKKFRKLKAQLLKSIKDDN